MAPRVVVIRLELGTPRLGTWCPACLLPSGYEIDLLRLTATGVSTISVLSRCNDCGRSDLRKIQPTAR